MLENINMMERFYRVFAASKIAWSEELQSWIVLDPKYVSDILRSPNFEVVEHQKRLSEFGAARNLDLASLNAVLSHVPLSHNGPEHRKLRRSMAEQIQKNLGAALSKYSDSVREKLTCIFSLKKTVELNEELFLPCTAKLFSELGELDAELLAQNFCTEASATQVFGLREPISDKRLKMMNEHVLNLSGQKTSLSESDLTPLATAIVGAETFHGSIIRSFISEMAKNRNTLLSAIHFSERLPSSDLPFIVRVAINDCMIHDMKIEKGLQYTLYLGSLEAGRLDLFFAAGKHACLGKTVTEMAWNVLTKELNQHDRIVDILEIEYRDPDYVFTLPKKIVAQVRNEEN